MTTIRTVYSVEPNFPATDQHPEAVRYQVSGYWVDAIGGEPTADQVAAFLAPPVPRVVTVSQAKRQLLAMGLLTPAEALANDIPAFLKSILDQMVGNKQAAQAADVAIRWHNASEWLRDDPLFAGGLLDAAAQALNVPANDATLDQFFTAAAAL